MYAIYQLLACKHVLITSIYAWNFSYAASIGIRLTIISSGESPKMKWNRASEQHDVGCKWGFNRYDTLIVGLGRKHPSYMTSFSAFFLLVSQCFSKHNPVHPKAQIFNKVEHELSGCSAQVKEILSKLSRLLRVEQSSYFTITSWVQAVCVEKSGQGVLIDDFNQ